jgi:hypothetical protein
VAQFDAVARKKLAAAGEAMADGSYPIRNAQDLANAYKDWIRTGRSPAVAAHIGQRAKALGLPNPISGDSEGASDQPPARDEVDVARRFAKKRS